jgi:GTP cyclohydrolase I
MLDELRRRLEAQTAHVSLTFPYFLERRAPVSGSAALMDYQCTFVGEASATTADFLMRVTVPVTTLCPCSKKLSEGQGAHNQRTYVTIEIRGTEGRMDPAQFVWIEELVEVAEGASSCPVYPLLKREDEKHVTVQAYENPRFVEDVVREVTLRLREDPRIGWFRVQARSDESIHNHSAFAEVEWKRADS